MNPEKPRDGGWQPANILIVDDTPANLELLTGVLKDRGYKVRPVPGGKLALLAARRDPPDLILLDINMPEMSGYEVCEHLKADETLKGIPVIFISALTEQLDKVKAFATGGVGECALFDQPHQPLCQPPMRDQIGDRPQL